MRIANFYLRYSEFATKYGNQYEDDYFCTDTLQSSIEDFRGTLREFLKSNFYYDYSEYMRLVK